jgi:hypothetical protein
VATQLFFMEYTITKLDNRYANRNLFAYMIEFGRQKSRPYSTGVLEFHRALQWFNRTWGFSVAVDLQQDLVREMVNDVLRNRSEPAQGQDNPLNSHWAYSSQYRNFRIYVRGDEELAMFQLVHAGS